MGASVPVTRIPLPPCACPATLNPCVLANVSPTPSPVFAATSAPSTASIGIRHSAPVARAASYFAGYAAVVPTMGKPPYESPSDSGIAVATAGLATTVRASRTEMLPVGASTW